MTNRMGCEMSERIASIASVSGLIGNQINCNPSRSLSMMHMHGTADGTITWDGQSGGFPLGQPVDTMINTWKTINNCPDSPVETALADIASDGYTIDHSDYSPCDDNTEVELYKINGAGHVWLSTGNDVDSRVEIWRFFYRNQMFVLPPPVTIPISPPWYQTIEMTPNPANDMIIISGFNKNDLPNDLAIYDLAGRLMGIYTIEGADNNIIDVSYLQTGIYLVKFRGIYGIHSRSLEKKLLIYR